ncbi:hypothetical protein WH95_00935 [Kiloniella litopenaei]|uniref:MerC domain-containing protein n=1 Tax=Kiloniella litopenaei TaxID=1549748 RepID=A0A0M2RGK6_9PROT|nr:MerC family mercury resistance protein [Kiloniella litopenaei]KKJ78683.1 hypothetical protein WH95_00935 [Kiloniella litopenaei]
MSPDSSDGQQPALNNEANNKALEQNNYLHPLDSGNKRPRISLIASAATTCSIILCYGTLMLINLLGKMGFEITVNETLWAGAITIASFFALLGLFVNLYRHKHVLPVVMGSLGCALINFVMHYNYNLMIELTGFACLCLAAVFDWRALKNN